MHTEELLQFVISIAEEFKAVDLKTLHITEKCSFTDYFVIMTGTSTTHIQSIAEEITLRCKKAGHRPTDVEGMSKGEWTLIDFGDVVVHIFSAEKREFYNLEEIWKQIEAPDLDRELAVGQQVAER
ncbi:ribosome silencing factor [Sulfidibacter corallicola]|uniref:Ribosomal silencing factor RsfS n=1 Tax=Sulfidibacter corallicola TaxID=2818388 RepID=A0A8A4TV72_SULCO|nr:ribosome silencing factor [Sulfidibacter corallicola]QTD53257.1 ribosome silencing factor [Sulfidibacter corallicola]